MTLGEWLRRNGKTQEWFAMEMGDACTQALVSKWVRGVVLPSAGRAYDIEHRITLGQVTERGLTLRYKRLKAKSKVRGELFRRERGIE